MSSSTLTIVAGDAICVTRLTVLPGPYVGRHRKLADRLPGWD
jgi:hypothetical protein